MNSDSKLMAVLGVMLTIIGYIIIYATRKKDKYAMHYAKQGFVLFFFWTIAIILFAIPIIGQILGTIMYVLTAALWIIGIVYALSDEEKNIPIVSAFTKFIKF